MSRVIVYIDGFNLYHAIRDRFDTALIISADTDLNAAVKLARREVPSKKIMLVAPLGRFNRNREIKPLFAITIGRIRSCLLPDEMEMPAGKIIRKPERYN